MYSFPSLETVCSHPASGQPSPGLKVAKNSCSRNTGVPLSSPQTWQPRYSRWSWVSRIPPWDLSRHAPPPPRLHEVKPAFYKFQALHRHVSCGKVSDEAGVGLPDSGRFHYWMDLWCEPFSTTQVSNIPQLHPQPSSPGSC